VSDAGGFIAAVEKVSLVFDKAVGALCAVFFGTMTIVVLTGVFFRYVLNWPLSWVEESARYLMIWGASSAISLGIKSEEHVGLTILLDSLKSRFLKGLLYSVITVLVFLFFAVLFLYSMQMVNDARTMQTQALGVTMAIPYFAIPVSMLFALIQLILVYVIKINRGTAPKQEPVIIDI